MPGPLKNARYRLEHLLVKAAAGSIPRIPRKHLGPLAAALSELGYLVDVRGRTNALVNLKALYPEKSLEERERMARQAFRYFTASQIDSFWSSNLTKDNYEEIVSVEFDSPEVEKDLRKSGAVWVTPHYGNFEWISLVMGFRDVKFLLIAQEFKNGLLTDLFTANREASGHEVTGQEGAVLKLFRNLSRGGNVALLNDLCIPPDQAAFPLKQFGFLTCPTLIHAELARRTGKPLVPAIAIPRAGGRHQMRFLDPIEVKRDDDPQEVAQECWNRLEPIIRAKPEPWLWMYKHWRYLPTDSPEDKAKYPPYANKYHKFDTLLKKSGVTFP